MEISRSRVGAAVELRLKGRLDEYWAGHLSAALDELIAEGVREIQLNLAEIAYLGSAGVGVLVKYQQELLKAKGTLVISVASTPVKRVLEMAKLGYLIVVETPPLRAAAQARAAAALAVAPESAAFRPTLEFQCVKPDAGLYCRLWGDPDVLRGRLLSEADSRRLRFPDSTFGLGLGAFGRSFEDCSGLFGEFLAVAGAAAYQPGDGSNIPDHVSGAAEAAPELIVVSSIACVGTFSHVGSVAHVSLPQVCDAALEAVGAGLVGIVVVGEVRGGGTIAVGVAGRGDLSALSPVLEPIAGQTRGWFHAALFSLSPKLVDLGLRTAVSNLFGSGTLVGVATLDQQAKFPGGICWASPIVEVVREGE